MIEALAPAKLTLTLRITGVRDDGYHLIDAEMATLDFGDRLEIAAGSSGVRMLDEAGRELHDVAPPGDNLVERALALAGRRAAVTVHKRIPAGAGTGGRIGRRGRGAALGRVRRPDRGGVDRRRRGLLPGWRPGPGAGHR